MTDKTDDGGPAFPRSEDAVSNTNKDFDLGGMTLRQWYKGQALQGLLASPSHDPDNKIWTNDRLAEYSGIVADAMIEEDTRFGDRCVGIVCVEIARLQETNAELLEALERVSKHMVQIPKYMQVAIAKAKS